MTTTGIWGEIVHRVPRAEFNEVVNCIGQKKIDINQDLWQEYHAMNEILLETRCFGESNPFPGIDHSKRFDSKGVKYAQKANLRILSLSDITLEQIIHNIDAIRTALELETSDLEDEIRSIQDKIDMRTDYFLCSQASNTGTTPQSPATKDDTTAIVTATTTAKNTKSSSKLNEALSKNQGQLLTSKSEHKLTSISNLTKSTNTTPLPSSAMSYHAPKACSRCNGRLDSDALVHFAAASRTRQKVLPMCTVCKEIDRKLKKSESKASYSNSKTDAKKTSVDTAYESMSSTASAGYRLEVSVPSTPLSTSFLTGSPIPPITSHPHDSLRAELGTAEQPTPSAESSKFRRRLQSVRDEKHFFDDDL